MPARAAVAAGLRSQHRQLWGRGLRSQHPAAVAEAAGARCPCCPARSGLAVAVHSALPRNTTPRLPSRPRPGRSLAPAPRRRMGLELSSRRSVQSVHQGAVTWLDLDHVEQRYLLAGQF